MTQSQWNIGCVGSQTRKFLALAMYISFFVCRFHLRWVANANPISSGIWALMLSAVGIHYPPEVRRGKCSGGLGVFLLQYFPLVKI